MQRIQTHLSEKQKTFCEMIFTFFKSKSNFQHFQKNMTLIAYVFPKLRTPKDVVREMSKKSRFRGPLNRQHGKRTETLFQSQQEHPFHIY